MNHKMTTIAAISAITLCAQAGAQDMKKALQEKFAAVKESVARNQAALRHYSWTEHTDILLKGEVKSTKDNLCRYGADGQVQKTAVGTPPPKKEMRGLKKKVAEKKVGELTDYMDRAASLVHHYMPPSPEKMQAAFQGGNVSVARATSGGVVVDSQDKQGFVWFATLWVGPVFANSLIVIRPTAWGSPPIVNRDDYSHVFAQK